jgi:hypothetical protein
LSAAYAFLKPIIRPVETILKRVGLTQWSTYSTKRPAIPNREQPIPPT